MTTVQDTARPVGALVRRWRERRRISQLELSSQTGVSTRHLSFVETGRARPSRAMVLRLSESLDVPLRDRNHLLVAAGFAPAYPQEPLDSAAMAPVRAALRQVLDGHSPNPAVVVDRTWNLLDANAAIGVLVAGVSPALLEPPANVLRIALHPDGMAPYIENFGEWRAHLLARLRRQVEHTGDPELAALHTELLDYPCDQDDPAVEVPGPGVIAVPLRLRHEGDELTFVSTVATFGTPLDITLAELVIESFYPADRATAETLARLAAHT
ncbi:helix-turn-helix protein [Murinocardiopsis flavida]|uniref:Helix-turn-helix protein n=1 Tax=Murinocardiopsis flavida TaxID=645275 RepID=A0A2P8D8S5_9ACTN|nr:helix-turn-helix transcriptional regulator [Murinocardiopsis flavida]PSK93612.1 helix-turn-helix protein [Murinocardiopsis flavida]